MKRDSKLSSATNMFKRFKDDALNSKEIILSKEEYAHVMSELNSHLSEEDRQSKLISKPIGDYVYLVVNHGFDDYTIIGKYPIDYEIQDL